MKLKNLLIVVNDIQISKAFYKELFGLEVITDFGKNVILTEGLVLQERKLWESLIGKEVQGGGHDVELYFEENNIDEFINKLESSNFRIKYLNRCMEHDWGQRVIRIYDPDNHVIEIGEALEYVARRFLKAGMTAEQTAAKTQLPLPQIETIRNQMREQ